MMNSKLQFSKSTLYSSRYKDIVHNSKQRSPLLKNGYVQALPLKFPRNNIIKHGNKSMLTESSHNPERSSIRVYQQANRSRFFEDSSLPLTHSERIAKQPSFLFNNDRKCFNPGEFSYLSRQSGSKTVRLRTFQDIGVTNNQRRVFTRISEKNNPMLSDRHIKNNQSLEKMWNQKRRQRDHGSECREALIWNKQLSFNSSIQNGNKQLQSPYNNISIKPRQFK